MPKLLAFAILLMLAGCGTITSQYAPEKMAELPLPAGSGRVVFSTGAAARCVSVATYLKLLPEGADREIARFSVDAYIVKSDFADHQGNLYVIPLPAGTYYFTPWTNDPLVRPILQPQATFSIAAGETVYIGEYYMSAACQLTTLYEVRDQTARDMALLKSKEPRFDTSKVTTRLMAISGGVPVCDATNSELSCHH